MAYQVNYIDSRGKKKYCFLSLGRLLRNLQSHVKMFKCEGGCSDLPVETEQDLDEPEMKRKALSWRDTRGYPIVFFDKAGTINARRHVAASRGLSNLWVFASVNMAHNPKEAGTRSCRVDMLTSRPFMIYLSLIKYPEDAICLFPFTPCLSCTIERGCLARVYRYFRDTIPPTGHLTLKGPGSDVEEMTWVTFDHIHEEHTVPR